MRRSFFSLLLFGCFVAGQASAQQLSPVVNPSRPSVTNAPEIGTPGVFEINGGLSATKDIGQALMWTTPLLLKYTLSENWEVRVGTEGPSFSKISSLAGITDANVWLQWTPSFAESNNLHWSLGAGANASVSEALSPPRTWDYTFGAAFSKTMGEVSLQHNLTFGIVGSAEGRPVSFLGSLLVSQTVGDWSPFLEAAYSVVGGANTTSSLILMGGTGFSVTSRLVFDVAIMTDQISSATMILAGFSIVP